MSERSKADLTKGAAEHVQICIHAGADGPAAEVVAKIAEGNERQRYHREFAGEWTVTNRGRHLIGRILMQGRLGRDNAR